MSRHILVIDDERSSTRTDVMVTYARTSADALDILETAAADGFVFDEVWFDHDLGGDDTTRPAAIWFEERAATGQDVPAKKAYVHTGNVATVDWLLAALRPLGAERRMLQ